MKDKSFIYEFWLLLKLYPKKLRFVYWLIEKLTNVQKIYNQEQLFYEVLENDDFVSAQKCIDKMIEMGIDENAKPLLRMSHILGFERD